MAIADVPFKERQRRAREEAILAAAAEILSERGYHEMSMDDIAARVGIAKGTIYLHFPSKEALAAALVRYGLESIDEFIAGLDRRQPVLARLGAVLRELLSRRDRLRFMRDDFTEMVHIIRGHQSCFAPVEGLRARVAALIEEGKRSGEIDPALHTDVAAGALFALTSPRSYLHLREGGEVDSAEMNASIVRLYLRGIARPGARVPVIEEEKE